MIGRILIEGTSRYHPVESWVYDRYIAPAVTDVLIERVLREFNGVVADDERTTRDLLDVGCGGGQNALSIARIFPSIDVTGVDISPEQVSRARRRAALFGGRARFSEGDALALPFEADRFDVVMSIGSIKHWPAPSIGLRECLRVLRPGGRLVIAEVDRGCQPEAARAFVHRFRIPEWMEGFVTRSFCRFVAGQSLDLEQARRLLVGTSLVDASVTLIDGLPAWLLTGTKPPH